MLLSLMATGSVTLYVSASTTADILNISLAIA